MATSVGESESQVHVNVYSENKLYLEYESVCIFMYVPACTFLWMHLYLLYLRLYLCAFLPKVRENHFTSA